MICPDLRHREPGRPEVLRGVCGAADRLWAPAAAGVPRGDGRRPSPTATAAWSPSSSPTSPASPPSRRSSTPRPCATSSRPASTVWSPASSATAAPSTSSSATRSWPSSAPPWPTRTTPSGRSAPLSRCARPSRPSTRSTALRLAVHFGVNTGLVYAGGVGGGGRQDYSVMGDAVNVAARLKAAAKPGEILVGADTYRQAEHLFDWQTAGPVQRSRGRPSP